MEQYIPKSALVAEIDRQKIGYNVDGKHSVEYDTTRKILNIIDTIEMKEVDLEKEYKDFIKSDNGRSMFETAEHFFELGIKASNTLTWEDISDIDDLLEAYEKTRPKREVTVEPVDDFHIGFATDDLSTSMRGGKVNVTARVSKEDFDKIIYSYGVYILDYLSEKGLTKKD